MTAIEYQNFVTKWTELEGGNIVLFWKVWNKPSRLSTIEEDAVSIISWLKLIIFFTTIIL